MPKKQENKAHNYLSNIDIRHIAFCKNPAVPDAVFALLKEDNLPEGITVLTKGSEICAINKAQMRVYNYSLVPDDPDFQGDVCTKVDIEQACFTLMKNFAYGLQDGIGSSDSHVQLTDDYYLAQIAVDVGGVLGKAYGFPKPIDGALFTAFQVTNADFWKKVEDGEFTGTSIGGTGKRTPVDAEAEKSGLGKALNTAVTSVKDMLKGDGAKTFSEAYTARINREDMWNIFDALNESIRTTLEDDTVENKVTAISATIDQFKVKMIEFVSVVKAGAEFSQANLAMLDDVLTSMEKLKTKVAAYRAKLDNKDSNKSLNTGETDMTKEEILKLVNDALPEAVSKAVGDAIKKNNEEVLPDVIGKIFDKKIEDIKKAAAPDPDKAPEMTETEKALDAKMDEITKRLEKIAKTPQVRNGGDPDEQPEVKKAEGAVLGASLMGRVDE